MKHIYKLGGDRKTSDGVEYTIKCVNDPKEYLADGWVLSLDHLKKPARKANANKKSGSKGSVSGT